MLSFASGQRADDLVRSFVVGRLLGMYVERTPVAALAGVVSSAWVPRAGDEPDVQRNRPNGCVELLCEVGAAPRVVGPLTAPSVDVLAPGATVVGLRFHP